MPADPLVGKVLAERFEVLERIGDGGTGVVYKAKQLSVDRIVAVKVLGAHVSTDPQWMKRFQNEARAASKLEHPNTVRVIDFGQTREGLLFIAMEFLSGRSLRAEIEHHKRLAGPRVLQIVGQICASLAEAHSQGIIHRDIKPDNIFLIDFKGGGDMVKVLDFSVAKSDSPDAQLTRAGVVFGTPAYMSPEQGRGIPLTPSSDLYAVGIVAYEMLMGRPPFQAAVPTEVVMMHLRNPPPPLQGVAPQIASLVMRTLEKDPKRRPQSAGELEAQCQQLVLELAGIHPAGPGRVATPPPQIAVRTPEGMRPTANPPRTQALPQTPLGAPPAAAPPRHGTMMLPEGGSGVAYPPGVTGLPAGPRDDWRDVPTHNQGFGGADTEGTVSRSGQGAGAPFWLAWALLGLGGGLAWHFWLLHRVAG